MRRILKFFTLLMAGSLLLVSCEEDDPANPIPESAQYGSLQVTISGNYPQDVPFTQTTDYKYMPENDFLHCSSVSSGEDITFFSVLRKIGQTEIDYYDIFTNIKFKIDSSGTEPEFDVFEFRTEVNVVNEEDKTFFKVIVDRSTLDFEVTQFSFNPENGKLKFTMSTTFLTENEYSSDLQIKVVGDVTVYRLIQYN